MAWGKKTIIIGQVPEPNEANLFCNAAALRCSDHTLLVAADLARWLP
jgi:hypothetical protein